MSKTSPHLASPKGRGTGAFTLVELIVVITILAILGTIAFLSFQGYSKSARDSTRASDIGSIKSALELFTIQTGYYPEPTGGQSVTFSGGEVWNQGVIGDSVTDNLQRLNKKPVDPLTQSEYTYSRLNTKKEYEIAAVFESNDIVMLDESYAADKQGTAFVTGNYNGVIAKVQTGSSLYILAVPSIINTDMNDTIYTSIAIDKLVFNGGSNTPDSYKNAGYISNTFTTGLTLGDLVVYNSGNTLPSNDSEVTLFISNLQNSFSGTNISSQSAVASIINTTDSNGIKILGASYVNQNLGGDVVINTNNTETIVPITSGFIATYFANSGVGTNENYNHSNTGHINWDANFGQTIDIGTFNYLDLTTTATIGLTDWHTINYDKNWILQHDGWNGAWHGDNTLLDVIYLDSTDNEIARIQHYKNTTFSHRLKYSLDGGSTWTTPTGTATYIRVLGNITITDTTLSYEDVLADQPYPYYVHDFSFNADFSDLQKIKVRGSAYSTYTSGYGDARASLKVVGYLE